MSPAVANDTAAPNAPARELLVFAFGDVLFAVDAVAADTVIAWREPMPLPGVVAEVLGVVQDRGRIVTVVSHPTGTASGVSAPASRIIICSTPTGHLGLPATSTRGVASFAIPETLDANQVFDTSWGPATLVKPSEIAGRLARKNTIPTR